jgi:hypothetical protein
MQPEEIAGFSLDRLIGRLLLRAALMLLIFVSAIVAVYQFTIAGSLALEMHYDAIWARLVVGLIYGGLILVCFAVLWALRHRRAGSRTQARLMNQRNLRLVMLLEALMLGYTLARKPNRTS